MIKITVAFLLLAAVALFLFIGTPSYREACIRSKVRDARHQMEQVKAGLDSCRDPFPQDASQLQKFPLPGPNESILIDPFTKKDFLFVTERRDHCIDWYLVCAGPDANLQFTSPGDGVVLYDPTNGMVSSGDILSTGTNRVSFPR